MLCLQDILSGFDEVKKMTSESEAVMIIGSLREGVFPERKEREVVLKLTLPSSANDNSLDVERKMYMLVHEKMRWQTPHLLEGLYESTCDDTALLNLEFSENRAEKSLFDRWAALRAKHVWKSYPKVRRDKMIEQLSELGHEEFSWDLVVQTFDLMLPVTKVHFVVTPKMKDIALADFIQQPGVARSLSGDDMMEMSLQVAQAIVVLEDNNINHHDLHLGNIFIRVLPKPDVIVYQFPKPPLGQNNYSVTSKFLLMLFDFDHATGQAAEVKNNMLENTNLCKSLGACSKFEKNLDWYAFVSVFVPFMKKVKGHVPEALENLLQGDVSWNDAYPGHPCSCEVYKNDKDPPSPENPLPDNEDNACLKCTLRTAFLKQMTSAETFFKQHTIGKKATPVLLAHTPLMKAQKKKLSLRR